MSLIGAMHDEELGSAVEVLLTDRESPGHPDPGP